MIPVLDNIVLEYANIKKDNNSFLNYCNRCNKHKHKKMKNVDVIFYQIKLSFILTHVFSNTSMKPAFKRIIQRSEIQTTVLDLERYGWVTNSLDIDNYWFSLSGINTIEDIRKNRSNYLEFINNNFELIEERNINFCDECCGKKLKMD